MACDVCGVCSLVRLETVAETRVKCTHGHLGVWKLLRKRRWAFRGGWAACERDKPSAKELWVRATAAEQANEMAAAVEAAVC